MATEKIAPSASDVVFNVDLGRFSGNPIAQLVARNYRYLVALLVTSVIAVHFLLVDQPIILLVAIVANLPYVFARKQIWAVLGRFTDATTAGQFRGVSVIAAVSVLMAVLALRDGGTLGALWVLYLPGLLLVSFYAQQRWYAIAAILSAVAAGGLRWLDLRGSEIDQWQRAGEAASWATALLLASFLVHIYVHAAVQNWWGAKPRRQYLAKLLERAVFERDGPALWGEIGAAAALAVGASWRESTVFVYDAQTASARSVEAEEFNRLQVPAIGDQPNSSWVSTFRFGPEIRVSEDGDWISRTIWNQVNRPDPKRVLSDSSTPRLRRSRRWLPGLPRNDQQGNVRIAVPLYRRLGPGVNTNLLATLVLAFPYSEAEIALRVVRQVLIEDLIPSISILGEYWLLRSRFAPARPGLGVPIPSANVVAMAIDVVCNDLGFSRCLISLVDEDATEIVAVDGRGVEQDLILRARHRLDSHDIQALTIRDGSTTVIRGADDDRLDRELAEEFDHHELIRVWTPLGSIGTIAAGYHLSECDSIDEQLVSFLRRIAPHIAGHLQRSLDNESQQRWIARLKRLGQFRAAWLSYSAPHGRDALEQWVSDETTKFLAQEFPTDLKGVVICGAEDRPIAAVGDVDGPDGNAKGLLVGTWADGETMRGTFPNDYLIASCGSNPTGRPQSEFATGPHKQVVSVPLLLGDAVKGLLVVAFREPKVLSLSEQELLKLVGAEVAMILETDAVSRASEQERMRDDLHDAAVSTLDAADKVCGLLLDDVEKTGTVDSSDLIEVRKFLRYVRSELRSIIAEVHEIIDLDSPIGEVFEATWVAMQKSGKFATITLRIVVSEAIALPRPLVRTLRGVFREAIANAVTKGNATSIVARLATEGPRLYFDIEDNGEGFDESKLDPVKS